MHAAAQRGPLKLLQLLLAHKADVDQVDTKGTELTPLHLAARAGAAAKVEALLAAGAQVAPLNSQGNTPLHLVSALLPLVSCQLQLVPRCVLQYSSCSPVTVCGAVAQSEAKASLLRPTSLCPLVAPATCNVFPTLQASVNGHSQVVELLLAAGADPTQPNKAGRSAADMAKTPQLAQQLAAHKAASS